MNRFSFTLAAFLLAGCGKPTAPANVEAAKAEPAKAERDRNVIELDADQQKQAAIKIEEVVSRNTSQVISASGRITMNEDRSWHVGAIAEGRVVRVYVNPGERVKKDQRLAGMHSHDIHETRAEYRKAQAELARSRSALAYSQKQRDRARRLYDLKAASLEQVEHAESELRNAQTAVENADTELARHRLHIVEVLQLPLDEHDEHKEGDTDHETDLIPIKAPADGVVITRKISVGSVASPGEEIFTIADLSSVWMIAQVNEAQLGKLRVGAAVRVQVQAYPERSFTGRITKIGDQLDPATRTIQVRVELANAGGMLKPEMYCTAEIPVGGSEPAVYIPQSSVQQVNGQSVVFIQKNADRFEVRLVQTGKNMDASVEIMQGLQAGDRVVTQGSYLLKSQLLKASLAEED